MLRFTGQHICSKHVTRLQCRVWQQQGLHQLFNMCPQFPSSSSSQWDHADLGSVSDLQVHVAATEQLTVKKLLLNWNMSVTLSHQYYLLECRRWSNYQEFWWLHCCQYACQIAAFAVAIWAQDIACCHPVLRKPQAPRQPTWPRPCWRLGSACPKRSDFLIPAIFQVMYLIYRMFLMVS